MKRVELKGLKFGRLTVLELMPPGNHGAKWLCECSCPAHTKCVVFGHSLVSKRTQSCGCWQKEHGHRNVIDMVGKRFGRLVIIERAGSIRHDKNSSIATWKVKCDCGKTKIIRGSLLRSGATASCGCLHKETVSLPSGRALRNTVLANYKNNSKSKNQKWELSDEQFDKLTQSNCHYCGIIPSATITKQRHPGSFTYNGIDRKDSEKGYVNGNVLPCCKDCNYAKGKMPYEKFIAYLNRVGKFQLEQ